MGTYDIFVNFYKGFPSGEGLSHFHAKVAMP